MKRRDFFYSIAGAAATLSAGGCGSSQAGELLLGREFMDAVARFLNLPGTPVYSIDIVSTPSQQAWAMEHLADRETVIGSAFKTFIVAKCLQDVEAGRLTYMQLVDINDEIRVNGSPVFINLAGSVQLRSVLDAMIAYSDNTATDAAMKMVGAEHVRAFLTSAGLLSTRIPDSIRIFESYAAGAPPGVDIGWEGIKSLLQGVLPGTPRPVDNDQVSIVSTMKELVSYYKRVLRGEFFSNASTVSEFKRVHADGNIFFADLPETSIYGKRGNASWMEFHVLCYAGQMIPCDGVTVTFAFAVNWNGPDAGMAEISGDFNGAIKDALLAIKRHFGTAPAK
ncbi:serine hydrolase [Noviherbaspirillum pedocola]|uniref:beta-lactamase n=1 Tax=Noviherbaspirillum pedocola TaxID=2801341 RepID=A0A934W5Q2_9BURK|nr:serine hydrolase [Noviherbaspirillum pedocola]MBK4733468.1 serine hydrolase [Noviherbaspirillum pedocola]